MRSPKKIAAISRQLATKASEDFHQLLRSLVPESDLPESLEIMFTSSQTGEGVSTVAISFGHFLAESHSHEKTALVEANFRRPCFQRLFGLPQSPSLHSVLNKEATLEEACFKLGSDSLVVVPAGPTKWAQDTLSTEGMAKELEKLLVQLKSSYKFIIVDTPPVIPYADATILAGFMDCVVLVVEANQTRAEVVDNACERLKLSKANIFGTILNKRQFHIPGWIYKFL